MRPNSEEMKGLGSGRWMQPLGKALSQLLSQSDTTPSWEYSVPYQGSTLSVFPCACSKLFVCHIPCCTVFLGPNAYLHTASAHLASPLMSAKELLAFLQPYP